MPRRRIGVEQPIDSSMERAWGIVVIAESLVSTSLVSNNRIDPMERRSMKSGWTGRRPPVSGIDSNRWRCENRTATRMEGRDAPARRDSAHYRSLADLSVLKLQVEKLGSKFN
jgi:hypothetical protein